MCCLEERTCTSVKVVSFIMSRTKRHICSITDEEIKETKTGVKDRSRNKGVGSNILSVCKLHIVMISALTLNIQQVWNSRFQTDYWTFPARFWLNYLLSRAVSTPRHPDCNTSYHELFSLVCTEYPWNFLNPLCRKCF